jgi:hypothetical protein
VLTPTDKATLVGSVRIAIDSQTHVPLRVQVYSKKLTNPAFEVGFTAVDFAKPDARQFSFTPPSGTTITESDTMLGGKAATSDTAPEAVAPPTRAAAPKIVGAGWSTIVVTPVGVPTTSKGSGGPAAAGATERNGELNGVLTGVLKALPTASGAWGSGHVLEGSLFSLVLTNDGRIALGAVPPEQLFGALAAK